MWVWKVLVFEKQKRASSACHYMSCDSSLGVSESFGQAEGVCNFSFCDYFEFMLRQFCGFQMEFL